jgi:hypothetical protein
MRLPRYSACEHSSREPVNSDQLAGFRISPPQFMAGGAGWSNPETRSLRDPL